MKFKVMFSSTDKKYYLKYKLTRDPFPLDVIDKILYLTPELDRRLEQLKQLIKASEELLVVISPAGGGKTVIAEHLESLKEPDWIVSLVQGHANMNIDTFALNMLQKIFPDKGFEKSKAVSQIHKFLESSALNGKIPVLIIDDAHELSFELLQFILQLTSLRHQESLFRIILFAKESINDLFAKQGLKELTSGLLHKINLPPFSKDQTRAYIENRLSLSGEINGNPFTQNDMTHIFRISAGLPRSINILARQIMQYNIGQKSGKSRNASRLIATTGIIIILMVPSYYFYSTIRHTSVDNSDIEQQIFEVQVALELPDPVSEVDILDNISAEQALETVVDNVNEIQPFMEQEEEVQIVMDKEVEEQVTQVLAGPSEIYSKNKTENIYNLDYIPEVIKGIKGPEWLRQQSASSIVLQIMSAREFNNINKLLKRMPGMQDKLSGYTNYTPSGKPRYLLYYGIYADRKSAATAIEDLPSQLLSINPWPRDIKSIVNQLDGLESRGYY